MQSPKRSFLKFGLFLVYCGFAVAMGICDLYAETVATDTAAPSSAGVESVLVQGEPAGALAAPGISDKITLDFKEADIGTVLRILSIKSGVNIVAGPEVTGTVTIRLENVPWEKALDVVLRTYDYVYERDGNIVRVTTRDKMALEPVVTQAFILNYAKAEEIKVTVEDMLTERGRVKAAERTNMVVVTDIPTQVYQIGEVIKRLDQKTSQAYVDSKIVRTDLGISENLGIQWNLQGGLSGSSRPTTFPFTPDDSEGAQNASPFLRQFYPLLTSGDSPAINPNDSRAFPLIPGANSDTISGGTFTFGTLDFSSFSSVLRLLKERDNTKVVSNPRIVVLNNQTAKVHVGQQVPLPSFERNENTGSFEVTGFNYRDVGVVMNVTPHINSAEEILVDLKPEVTSEGTLLQFTSSLSAPRFSVTEAETQVLIRSGETIAIGGLLTDSVSINEDRIPYLSDIPLLGKLFRSKRQTSGSGNTKTETLFFVTVTLVDTEGQPTGEMANQKDHDSKNKGVSESSETPADQTNASPQVNEKK